MPSWDVISSHHHDLALALNAPSITKMMIIIDWSGLNVFQSLEESYQTY